MLQNSQRMSGKNNKQLAAINGQSGKSANVYLSHFIHINIQKQQKNVTKSTHTSIDIHFCLFVIVTKATGKQISHTHTYTHRCILSYERFVPTTVKGDQSEK